MNIKKLFLIVLLSAVSVAAVAQKRSAQDYLERYNLLVSKLGTTGVGIETLLDNWEADYPEDIDMLSGKFIYYFTKAQSTVIEKKDKSRYLGAEPVLTLKDSLGNPVNYFEFIKFDDETFGRAMTFIDKAVQLNPDRLDFRQAKISALIAYENESPDMATSSLNALIDYNVTQHPKWEYTGSTVNQEVFDGLVQDFCYAFFKYSSPSSYNAFKSVSEKMLTYYPKNTLFLDNLGSYYLVCERDNKTALKYYNKVLKIKPDDITAIKNVVILARNTKNVKMEKKYLAMLAKYAEDETEKKSAQVRLDYLNGK